MSPPGKAKPQPAQGRPVQWGLILVALILLVLLIRSRQPRDRGSAGPGPPLTKADAVLVHQIERIGPAVPVYGSFAQKTETLRGESLQSGEAI